MGNLPNFDNFAKNDFGCILPALHARDGAAANRQLLYQLAKAVPEYRSFYEEAEAFYRRYCEAMGFDPEPVFDREEYERGSRYQGILKGEIA